MKLYQVKVLGILTLCTSILKIYRQSHIVTSIPINGAESKNRSVYTAEEHTIDEDHCNADGSICVYHDICYDTGDDLWYTLSDLKQFPLLNDDNFTYPNPMMLVKNYCQERFTPSSRETFPNKDNVLLQTGTTYFVCSWVNHFGHVFVQMLPSSIHAIVKAGFEHLFRSGSIKFLIDNRAPEQKNSNILHGTARTPFEVFKFATRDPSKVKYLDNLKRTALSHGKSNVCFERFIVGMRFTDLAYPRFKNTLAGQLEADMLKPLRDYLDELYPSTEKNIRLALSKTLKKPSGQENNDNDTSSAPLAPAECTLTFLRREGHSREIKNFSEVMEATKSVFHEDKWHIQSVSFDGPKLLKQYWTIRNTILLVSVSGTGSHMAMFLPDGAASIEIHYNNTLEVVNKGICHVMPKLTCLSSKSRCPYKEGPKSKMVNYNCKHREVMVDLKSFTESIKTAKRNLSKGCDRALSPQNKIISKLFGKLLNE